MVSMPSCIAFFGVWMSTFLPSMRISPWSGRCTPDRILISVDLPAPLSPTRPTDSPSAITRSTPFRAWTPEYHLCRPRHSMMGGFIGHLYLDAACGAAQPRIGDDGEDGQ